MPSDVPLNGRAFRRSDLQANDFRRATETHAPHGFADAVRDDELRLLKNMEDAAIEAPAERAWERSDGAQKRQAHLPAVRVAGNDAVEPLRARVENDGGIVGEEDRGRFRWNSLEDGIQVHALHPDVIDAG